MTKRRSRRRGSARTSPLQWRRVDLHLHTLGSSDYQEPNISYLDILRQAELRNLDIIAFTDHNSVAGFAAMRREIELLLYLEEIGRIEQEEQRRLKEYRRLLEKIHVLPGFEFTATFGFHILGIFPQTASISFLEHLLLTLRVPADKLSDGSSTVGATSDVLTAYRIINEAGGIVIAAHVNSSNGVAMRGLDFGGQTRIAYTQDPNLHCLEVTDLEKRSRYTTRRFFDGSKPEYPRAMRCIQGSDAHRLMADPGNPKSLGVGERVTEVLLPELSFEALAAVLKGSDQSLTRPFRGKAKPLDFVQMARDEGASIIQSFHTSTAKRGGHFDEILQDVCAMSNTNGGSIYLGASANASQAPVGVREPNKVIEELELSISTRFSPEPAVDIDTLRSQSKTIVRLTVANGTNMPYALDDNRFYVRDEAETSLAVRDEIVRLVEKRLGVSLTESVEATPVPTPVAPTARPAARAARPKPVATVSDSKIDRPRTGVQIVDSQRRNGQITHTLRDLRKGNLIKNVTRKSARKLWHYAIRSAESVQANGSGEKTTWYDDKALLNRREKDDHVWYDLAQREGDKIHRYYGVTDSGLSDDWRAMIEKSEADKAA